jgi:two-component system, sensor histidine kinase and response regulator
MKENTYKSIAQQTEIGFACLRVIKEHNNNPIDFEFLETNSAFSNFFNPENPEIIGKGYRESIPEVDDNYNILLSCLRNTATYGESQECLIFSRLYNTWISLQISSPNKDLLTIMSFENKQIKSSSDKRNSETGSFSSGKGSSDDFEKYKAMYNNAPLSFQSLDDDGCFIDVNPMWLKVMGYHSEEVIGTWFGSYLHPNYVEHFRINFLEFKKRGYISGIEFQMRRKDGNYIYVAYEGCIAYTHDGKFKQTYCVFKEITSQKTTEDALKQSERLLNATQHISKVGGWEYDVRKKLMTWTKETFIIHDADANLILSGTPSQLIQSFPFYTPDDSRIISKAMEICISDATPFDLEVPFTSLKGRKKWVRIKAEGVIEQNQVVNIIGNIMDITDRKIAEEERITKGKLEKQIALAEDSLRFKQNFLANMSHEMRTPLTGILGMAEILRNTPLNHQQHDYLSTIIHSGENLREIINNVLDFSKIEAGKVSIKNSTFTCESLLTNALKFFNSICRKPVVFESITDPNLPEWIVADKSRINQIVNNLISNAVKFTQKGKIIFHSQLIDRDTDNNKMEIRISISDTGKGIPEHTYKKLFKPFSQIEDEDTRGHEGTGLGLSICSELVKLLGGRIGMKSQPDKGSVFWFTFMAQHAKMPIHTQEEVKISLPAKKLRILLAEDKAVNQKVIKLMLSSMSHTVTIAKNGAEALEIFKPGEFDLILMDIQMPVLDGIKATQQIRKKYQHLPPIIGLSANAFEGDREKYMAQGLDEYLIKPLKTDEFESIMNKFFS